MPVSPNEGPTEQEGLSHDGETGDSQEKEESKESTDEEKDEEQCEERESFGGPKAIERAYES